VRGTILGVHEGSYDVLYEGGEGDMMKAGSELRTVEDSAPVGADVANVGAPKKKSSIGWNAGAFADEVQDANGEANDEIGDAEVLASVPPPKASNTTTTSPSSFSPMVGDRVEARDFATKSWKAARVVGMDDELKTWDLRFEDSTEAKGVPLSLLRERKQRKKREKRGKATSSTSSSSSMSSANVVPGVPSNNRLDEIVALCSDLTEKEMSFVVDMIKSLKQLKVNS